jgi:hypothetical protein
MGTVTGNKQNGEKGKAGKGIFGQLTPSQIVEELDKYIIGQENARNRLR